MADLPMNADGPNRRAGYKSWKKKYRKMRITFEQKMQEGEEIFRQETKAQATVKRIAEENDRLLDLLLDINNCPQIPTEKRIDVSLPPPTNPNEPCLDIDREHDQRKGLGMKRLADLLADVPHLSYAATKDTNPPLVRDFEKTDGEAYPASFLSPDDVDNYLYTIDTRLDPEKHISTLAPLAHPDDHPPLHPLLRNPNSSTSWLRRHAPHIFLQGHDGGDGGHDGDEDGGHHHGSGGRKSRGGAKGERGGRPSTRGKRGSAATRTPVDRGAAAGGGDGDVSMDDDVEIRSTPVPKGKRKRDDDPGYRPKGGSGTRPTKKKRKSEGPDGTPTARKPKKETPTTGTKSDD
ncbi:hypothetical protein ACRE_041620 [Hapsidospora chrysogenum ATCC 11550]|uniref:Uncharacterized protein n=1 Tax=Hapsidospora chrysogenum (strain ATCC 11550 / CBS 779.69 / DSM 880 / IAM 14645 / JCM 23072 / IMI 49137) TaxID=857340 RepID=A0A086T6P3_HAPC1|nr:hypothetical protein ACRE_041620 [Hapsidospora chrysogenum ATCC 11550]